MKKISGIVLVSRVVSFYSVSGTFPPISNTVSRLSLFFLFCVGSFLLLVKVLITDFLFTLNLTFINALLYITTSCTVLAFNVLCFANIWLHSTAWRDLFNFINKFDFTMEGYRILMEKNVLLYYIKIIVLSIGKLVLLVYLFMLSVNGNLLNYEVIICHSYLIFTNMQMFTSILVLWDLLNIISKRYNFVNEKIKEIYQSPKSPDIFWNKQQLKISISLLNDMVMTINEFFGHRILITLTQLFFNVLSVLQYTFYYFPHDGQPSFPRKCAILMETFWLLVSILYCNKIK